MIKKALPVITFTIVAAFMGQIYAQAEPVNPGQGPIDLPPVQGTLGAPRHLITTLVETLLPVAIGLAGFLAVIVIVISGIQFATSSGNPEGAAAARGRLVFALVGFIVIIMAYALTRIIDILFLNRSGIFPG